MAVSPTILAVETSTDTCSVALRRGDQLWTRCVQGVRHSNDILPMLEQLENDSAIRRRAWGVVAFGRGPGSFTGLRIGAGVAQGLAYALDLPVVPVSSLAALAQTIDGDRVLTALDARMGEIYWGMYRRDRRGLMVAAAAECVTRPEAVPLPRPGEDLWIGAGSGWEVYHGPLEERLGGRLATWRRGCKPTAAAVALLAEAAVLAGDVMDPEAATPVYLRDDVARKAGDPVAK